MYERHQLTVKAKNDGLTLFALANLEAYVVLLTHNNLFFIEM